MSLDLILYGADKATFAAFAKNNPPANPLLDSEGNTREGVSYCWWGGNGKLMTAPGDYSDENNIIEPTFLPGVVALLKIHSSFFEDTKLADQTFDNNGAPELEQHQRSSVVKYIKDNGTPGTMAGITYYELDNVRIFRPSDVEAFLAANGVPGHTWVGGNSY